MKKNHPNLVKLLNEAKGKLSDSDYKWLVKVFEAQEELTNLENQDNPKPKPHDISDAKWKLRSFQSKLKKEQVGDLLTRGKDLIEKQISSHGISPAQTLSSSSQQLQHHHSSSSSQKRKIQQQKAEIQVDPKNK